MTDTHTNAWATRWGTLVSCTPRQGANGPYATFELRCATFTQIGAAFGADRVKTLERLVGKKVQLRGPMEARRLEKEGGKEVKAFKAVYIEEKQAA